MKKLIIVINEMNYGGGQRVVANLSNYFSDRCIDVILLSISSKGSVYPLHENVRQLTIKKHEQGKNKLSRLFGTITEVRDLLAKEKPDIVLSFLVDINILIIPAMFFQKIPLVISERNDPVRNPSSIIKRFLRKILYRFAEGYVFQTEQARDYFSDSIKERSCVIPNPIFEESIPERYMGKPEDYVVAVGRLEKQKNHKLLIDSFCQVNKIFSNTELRIYGEGSLRGELETYISSKKANQTIHLMGASKHVLEHVKRAKAFVLSSDYEGMPNALIEAMACGIPCISTDCPCGGPDFLITNGENGILVPTQDEESLSVAITHILSDEAFSKRLSDNAYKIHETLNENEVFGKWNNYLECIVRSQKK